MPPAAPLHLNIWKFWTFFKPLLNIPQPSLPHAWNTHQFQHKDWNCTLQTYCKKIVKTGKTKVTETTNLFRQLKLFSNKFKDYGMTRISPIGNQSLAHAMVTLCSTWNCIALLKQKLHLGLEKKITFKRAPTLTAMTLWVDITATGTVLVLMSVLKHCPLISLPKFFRFTGGLRWHSDPCKHTPKKNLRVSSSYNAIHRIANHPQISIFFRRENIYNRFWALEPYQQEDLALDLNQL
jgi:hypothetical protein